MAVETTWTGQDAVAFTAGTLSTIADCATQVGSNLNRTLSGTSSPTSTEVQNWLIRGKEELLEEFDFPWKRLFVYADTADGTYRYALPKDFTNEETLVRDLDQDRRLSFMDRISFNTDYPDPAGSGNATPRIYTIKDRELWLHAPANGIYRLELEYQRSGDDATATDISYLPELMRFKICDFATFRSFLKLEQFDSANMYKMEWERGLKKSKRRDGVSKWAELGFHMRNWHNVK